MASLAVDHLSIHFGGLHALRGVTFEVADNELCAVIGPNGAGKTTLFNSLTGSVSPDGGRVRLDGEDVTGLTTQRLVRAGMARTFQHTRLFTEMTVLENVMVGAQALQRSSVADCVFRTPRFRNEEAEAKSYAEYLLECIGLAGFANHQSGSLAYGHQRLVEIARAMASRPKVLLLDEPAAGMHTGEKAVLGSYLRSLLAPGLSIVLVEHDMEMVMNVSDHVVVLDFGAVIGDGSPVDVRAEQRVIDAYLGSGRLRRRVQKRNEGAQGD